jgi:hypothetical protein
MTAAFNVAAFVQELRGLGLDVRAGEGDRVVIDTTYAKLPDSARATLQENKPAVLAYLRRKAWDAQAATALVRDTFVDLDRWRDHRVREMVLPLVGVVQRVPVGQVTDPAVAERCAAVSRHIVTILQPSVEATWAAFTAQDLVALNARVRELVQLREAAAFATVQWLADQRE